MRNFISNFQIKLCFLKKLFYKKLPEIQILLSEFICLRHEPIKDKEPKESTFNTLFGSKKYSNVAF